MPELQSCYFCGEIGDALTAFDVVPADLADESTQRTVVVCSTCHRKLDTVLAPLRTLAVEDSAGDASETDDAAGPDGAGRSPVPDDADQPLDAERPLAPADWDEESGDDATVGSSDDDTEPGEITFAETAGESDDATDETDTGIAFSDADPGRIDGTEESILGGHDENATGEPEGEIDESTEETDTTNDDSSDDDTANDGSTSEPKDDPPAGYRKVVRLLQNREFPVERASFVELASNAYELDEADVSASLDRLVDRGALVASDGQLQKP